MFILGFQTMHIILIFQYNIHILTFQFHCPQLGWRHSFPDSTVLHVCISFLIHFFLWKCITCCLYILPHPLLSLIVHYFVFVYILPDALLSLRIPQHTACICTDWSTSFPDSTLLHACISCMIRFIPWEYIRCCLYTINHHCSNFGMYSIAAWPRWMKNARICVNIALRVYYSIDIVGKTAPL